MSSTPIIAILVAVACAFLAGCAADGSRREPETRSLLGIPETYVQTCLLPVARLRPGTSFGPAPRRSVEEVVAVDGWDGAAL